MKKVVTFGELMLRLAPKGYLRFVQADEYEATFGGAEANVAVSLALLGENATFVSKLPNNDIGQAAINSLRKYGVDTSKIVRGGDRVGIYYCEKGASQRPSKVVYDRAYSSISTAKLKDFCWTEILNGADLFHFTGITAALSSDMPIILEEALKEAKKNGVKVSVDFNYRSKLWSDEKSAQVMKKLVPYADIFIGGNEDMKKCLGIMLEDEFSFEQLSEKMQKTFRIKVIAKTERESFSANDNTYSGKLYVDGKIYTSRKYALHIVDRVGGGDAFDGGLLYALLNDYAPKDAVEFAAAAAALKHSIEGDMNLVSVDEVKALQKGSGSGKVQR